MGDLHEDRMIDIWNNEKYQEIRDKLSKRKYSRQNIPICSECDA